MGTSHISAADAASAQEAAKERRTRATDERMRVTGEKMESCEFSSHYNTPARTARTWQTYEREYLFSATAVMELLRTQGFSTEDDAARRHLESANTCTARRALAAIQGHPDSDREKESAGSAKRRVSSGRSDARGRVGDVDKKLTESSVRSPRERVVCVRAAACIHMSVSLFCFFVSVFL
jgi:hypothetical protein